MLAILLLSSTLRVVIQTSRCGLMADCMNVSAKMRHSFEHHARTMSHKQTTVVHTVQSNGLQPKTLAHMHVLHIQQLTHSSTRLILVTYDPEAPQLLQAHS